MELRNRALTEFQVQLLLQGYHAGIKHAESREARGHFERPPRVCSDTGNSFHSRAESKQKDASAACSKHAPRDPLVETLVAVEEGRLEGQEGVGWSYDNLVNSILIKKSSIGAVMPSSQRRQLDGEYVIFSHQCGALQSKHWVVWGSGPKPRTRFPKIPHNSSSARC